MTLDVRFLNVMKKQPDFKQLFYDYFGSKPKKVNYIVRHDSNRYHDLIFLNSLIHDSRFKRKDTKVYGKKLIIKLNRDCWELGFVEQENNSELHIANSQLTISPIIEFEWRFQNDSAAEKNTDLWIDDILIERESYAILKVVLEGDGWSLHVKVIYDDFKMRIQDLEVPYLYSQKGMTEPGA